VRVGRQVRVDCREGAPARVEGCQVEEVVGRWAWEDPLGGESQEYWEVVAGGVLVLLRRDGGGAWYLERRYG